MPALLSFKPITATTPRIPTRLRQTAARLGHRLREQTLSNQMMHHSAIWDASFSQPERAILMNVLPTAVLLRKAYQHVRQHGWQASVQRIPTLLRQV